jgi:hypothetical protein
MNESTEPSLPSPRAPQPPALPSPLPPDAGMGLTLEALLKRPAQLVDALQREGAARMTAGLVAFAVFALAAYGVLVGTFSGGAQIGIAAAKVSGGALASALICLPSLFIFACLTGAEVTLRGIVGVLAGILALAALLLVGFAPVAWVFSQSTSSVAFIGFLHVVIWLIAVGFGLRLPRVLMQSLRVREMLHIHVWAAIFILVTLQMTTALRPIIGTSERLFPDEKKFFVAHWIENLTRDAEKERARE